MKVCTYCNTTNEDNAKACSSCGGNSFKSKCGNCGMAFDSGLYCPKCGVKAGSTEKKCSNCGTKYFSNVCPNCGYTEGRNQNAGNTTVAYANVASQSIKKRKTWLWILGWIFIFPIPLTILMLRNQKLSKGLRIGIVIAAWLVYLLIGLSGRNSTENSSNTSTPIPSIEGTESQKDNADELLNSTPSSSSIESDNVLNTEHDYVESELIKRFLFDVDAWDDITKDESKKLGENIGLTFDMDMGWGGTSWQYYFRDSDNEHSSLTLYFVEPQKENFKEHLKFFEFKIVTLEDVSLKYYSSWNRDNDDDGMYGFYVGETQFSSLAEAYEYYITLAQ